MNQLKHSPRIRVPEHLVQEVREAELSALTDLADEQDRMWDNWVNSDPLFPRERAKPVQAYASTHGLPWPHPMRNTVLPRREPRLPSPHLMAMGNSCTAVMVLAVILGITSNPIVMLLGFCACILVASFFAKHVTREGRDETGPFFIALLAAMLAWVAIAALVHTSLHAAWAD